MSACRPSCGPRQPAMHIKGSTLLQTSGLPFVQTPGPPGPLPCFPLAHAQPFLQHGTHSAFRVRQLAGQWLLVFEAACCSAFLLGATAQVQMCCPHLLRVVHNALMPGKWPAGRGSWRPRATGRRKWLTGKGTPQTRSLDHRGHLSKGPSEAYFPDDRIVKEADSLDAWARATACSGQNCLQDGNAGPR